MKLGIRDQAAFLKFQSYYWLKFKVFKNRMEAEPADKDGDTEASQCKQNAPSDNKDDINTGSSGSGSTDTPTTSSQQIASDSTSNTMKRDTGTASMVSSSVDPCVRNSSSVGESQARSCNPSSSSSTKGRRRWPWTRRSKDAVPSISSTLSRIEDEGAIPRHLRNDSDLDVSLNPAGREFRVRYYPPARDSQISYNPAGREFPVRYYRPRRYVSVRHYRPGRGDNPLRPYGCGGIPVGYSSGRVDIPVSYSSGRGDISVRSSPSGRGGIPASPYPLGRGGIPARYTSSGRNPSEVSENGDWPETWFKKHKQKCIDTGFFVVGAVVLIGLIKYLMK